MYNQDMTFVLAALRDKPEGLFLMDDTSPLQDYSGYNRVATVTGTPAKHAGLVKGASYAPVFTNTVTATFATTVFKQYEEFKSFTLAAHIRKVAGTGEQQILGNAGQMDGITINDTVISFVTKYTTAPEARCSYDLQVPQNASVWAIHNESKNSLYVNGELVDEIELTPEQQADTFVSTSANLVTGAAGTSTVAVNAVSYYPFALSPAAIARQHQEARAVSNTATIASEYDGNLTPLTLQQASTFLNQEWSTSDDWNAGRLSNVSVVRNELIPQFDGDVSVQGYWYDSVAIDSANTTSIYGVSLNWLGEGVTVETSTDGTTWTAATRGRKVSTITEGYNPTDKVLQVRVRFPGGITDDPAYLSSLTATGILTNTSNVVAGRTVTYATATPELEYPHLDFMESWGADISSGGSLVVSADSLESSTFRTAEVWIRRNGTQPTFTVAGTPTITYYQNGVSGTVTLGDQVWTLLHIIYSTAVSGTFTIAGPAQVGHIVLYERAIDAAESAKIYASYAGQTALRVDELSSLNITETSNAAEIYAYDWTITGAG